ncbi:MAG TPA: pilus assembly protein [Colwellia sp.]|nr:pilus assembly protein [Colwellia sp.]|tara:strand:- start:120 stop:746 length:627 start_codon:yes stop_codon:yes gene_type:complete
MQYTNLKNQLHQKTSQKSVGLQSPTPRHNLTQLKHKVLGFTLIEVLVTIAIAGIAFSIAIPGLNSFTLQMRVDNEVSEIQRLLMTTRNAAINSGAQVSLCPLAADDTCADNNNWAERIGVITNDGLIKEREAISYNDKLQFPSKVVTYSPSGQLANNSDGRFSYCPQGNNEYSRAVTLSLSGRTYLSVDINGDGRDQDRNNNNNIKCD